MSLPPVLEEPIATRKFSLAEWHRMIDLGFFERENCELIEGKIISMSPQNGAHNLSTTRIGRRMEAAFGAGFFAQLHSPLSLPNNSEPEPDVAIIKGDENDFNGKNPSTAELVIEVSFSTYAYDRHIKAKIYAAGRIQEYWIVNLLKDQIEVLRKPRKVKLGHYEYRDVSVFKRGDSIATLAFPNLKIAVDDILLKTK